MAKARIHSGKHQTTDKELNEQAFLKPADINKMVRAAGRFRHKTRMVVLWESGLRLDEIKNISDINWEESTISFLCKKTQSSSE